MRYQKHSWSTTTPHRQVIEIKSDTSLGEAVRLLSQNEILSASVVDVDAPEDASWIDRYIGMVEFARIVVWILHQVFATEAYANALPDRKKHIDYKNFSSVVSKGSRFDFLSDFVPEKVKAEDALKEVSAVEI